MRRLFLISGLLLSLGAALLAGTARAAAPPQILTGLDAGWPDVRGWDRFGHQANQFAPWGEWPLAFSPYPTYQNGVRVAVGDVTGDGRPEIVAAPAAGGFTELRVFDGQTFRELGAMLPFQDAAWWAGAFVATGDTNGDGRADIVDGLDTGCCTRVNVVDAASGLQRSGFSPFGDRSEVGARVAAADLNGDGKAEVLAVPVGGTRVQVFAPNGGDPFRSFSPFAGEETGGAAIAAGDVTGTPRPEIVVAAPTRGGAQVKVLNALSGETLGSFFPYDQESVTNLDVATGDVDGDGHVDIILLAKGDDGTQVKVLYASGEPLESFYVLDPAIVPGASLAAGDLDGDGKAEIVLGGGPTHAPWPPVANGPDQRVAVYRADGTELATFSAYPGLFQGGVRVALGNLVGDERPEMVTAPGPGMEAEIGIFSQEWVNGRDRGTRLGHFLAFEREFQGGASVALGDVDGDGRLEIVAGSGRGRRSEVRVFDVDGRQLLSLTDPFGAGYAGGLSVAAGDLDSDGRVEIVVGSLAPPMRVRAFSGTKPYGPLDTLGFVPGAGAQVAVADLNGTGYGAIVVGPSTGTDSQVAVLDPLLGAPFAEFRPFERVTNGVRLAAGDLNGDGRDELVVSPGFGGDVLPQVQVFTGTRLRPLWGFSPYNWGGAGTNVAVERRVGLPIASEARALKLVAGKRRSIIVARFRDASRAPIGRLAAEIEWGDGTSWNGVVVERGGGVYDVRSAKRYARPGRYAVTVTFRDEHGRSSTAHSVARVARPVSRPRRTR